MSTGKKRLGKENMTEIRNPSQHQQVNPKIYPGFETGNESFSFYIKNTSQDLFQEGLHRLLFVLLYQFV